LLAGTLDTLMALMDELAKHDGYLATSCLKVCRQLVELKLESEDEDGSFENTTAPDVSKIKLDELLTVGQGTEVVVGGGGGGDSDGEGLLLTLSFLSPAAVDPYLRKFRWNSGRWDYEKNSLQSITDDIMKTATSIDGVLRQKGSEWVSINRSIQSGGVLFVRID
jgi:hypothetical protein